MQATDTGRAMETDEMTAGPEAAPPREDEDLVPAWLAGLVLVLLLAVFGVGGFLLRGYLERGATPASAKTRTLEREVRQNPSSKEAHLALGFAYQTERRYKDAIKEYDIVLKEEPRNTAALYNKGNVLMQTGSRKEAENAFWKVLEISPTHVLAAEALGEYYASRHQYKSLLIAVKPAAEAEPTMADLQYLMGLAYENLGQRAKAVDRYRAALSYAPDLEDARQGLARVEAGK